MDESDYGGLRGVRVLVWCIVSGFAVGLCGLCEGWGSGLVVGGFGDPGRLIREM